MSPTSMRHTNGFCRRCRGRWLVGLSVLVLACGRSPQPAEIHSVPPPPGFEAMEPAVRAMFADRLAAVRRLEAMTHDAATDSIQARRANAHGELGLAHHAYDDLAGALVAYGNARRLSPQAATWWLASGHAYRAAGQTAPAHDAYREALRHDSDAATARLALGDMALEAGKLEEAQEVFETGVGLPGIGAASRLGLGRVALLRGDAALAITHLEAALERQPNASPIRYALGQAYRSRSEPTRAAVLLNGIGSNNRGQVPVVVVDPIQQQLDGLRRDAAVHERRALSHVATGRWGAASAELRQALTLDPDRHETRYNLAVVQLRRERFDDAEASLRRLLAADPLHLPASVLLARLLRGQARYEEARTRLDGALVIDPVAASVWLEGARLDAVQGQLVQAEAAYERARILAPGSLDARIEHIRILLRLGEHARARSLIAEDIRSFPDSDALATLRESLDSDTPQSATPDPARS